MHTAVQRRYFSNANLTIIAKKYPTAFRIQGSKLLESAQLSICQSSIELCIECPRIVSGRPVSKELTVVSAHCSKTTQSFTQCWQRLWSCKSHANDVNNSKTCAA